VDDGKRGLENALRANPLDVKEQYERQTKGLGFNENTVKRIFQLMGWQVRKRTIGFRPHVQALPSGATAPNERWPTDMSRVWAGRDGWATLALVIGCHTRELLGWDLSRSGRTSTASSALLHALIARFGTLGRAPKPFLLRSDNGLVFTSRDYTALVRSYGLRQEFITPHCPQQNGMVERDPHAQGAMRAPPLLRNPAVCRPCHCRLDSVLQPSTVTPSAEDEKPAEAFALAA